ncbi:MAG: hypothetical protein WKF87_13475 [Chryseolinea sp.]
MTTHETLPDFILFLYVHMSQVDNNYDPLELGTIKRKMGKLFPADTDFERKLYSTIRAYNNFEKSGLNDFFERSLKHFGSQQDITGIYSDLYEIIQADGKLVQAETSSLEMLMKIIEQHSEVK